MIGMDSEDLANEVATAIAGSELIRAVQAVARDGGVRFALGNATLRQLTATEIARLEQLGNLADDWSKLRVSTDFSPDRVRHSEFHGEIVLGHFAGHASIDSVVQLPSGIYRSTIANCVIGHNALVRNVGLLANYVVGPNVAISDCGSITCEPGVRFGNGQQLPLAIEIGGRDLPIYAEISVEVARLAT